MTCLLQKPTQKESAQSDQSMFALKQPGLTRPPKDEEDNEWCHDRFALIDRSESPADRRRVDQPDPRIVMI